MDISMKIWIDIIRPLKRFQIFEEGVKNFAELTQDKEEADWAICWNHTDFPSLRTIVAENPYLSDSAGRPYYALSVGGHNGSGRTSALDRWDHMELKPEPWRDTGDWILVCTQRGIGTGEMRMSAYWPMVIHKQLFELTEKHIEIRKPPSRDFTQKPLQEVFERAFAVVIWTSNVGTLALYSGIPVYLCGPHHIMEDAMERDLSNIDTPSYLNRDKAFRRLSGAQFTHEEIRSGFALELLIGG